MVIVSQVMIQMDVLPISIRGLVREIYEASMTLEQLKREYKEAKYLLFNEDSGDLEDVIWFKQWDIIEHHPHLMAQQDNIILGLTWELIVRADYEAIIPKGMSFLS